MRILTDAIGVWSARCVKGIVADEKRCAELLENSLVLVTALAPRIGYDKAAAVAKHAIREGLSLRAAALAVSGLSVDELDQLLSAENMLALLG